MTAIHLFSENRAAIVAIRRALAAGFEVELHRNAARLSAAAIANGGAVVVDMDEPDGWWRATLAEAIARPHLPTLLVTARPVARDVVLAVRLGAQEVFDWTQDADPLRAAVQRLTTTRTDAAASRATARCRLDLLTGRQRQILALASTGMASKAIARALSLSTRTVEAHRIRMVKRLMAKSFLELVSQQLRQQAPRPYPHAAP